MTREEAVIWLKSIKKSYRNLDICDVFCNSIDMAIEALQESERNVDRMVLLLRKCYELFSRQNESPFVLNLLEETVYYDDAECDGSCLMEDIDEVLLDNMQEGRNDNLLNYHNNSVGSYTDYKNHTEPHITGSHS